MILGGHSSTHATLSFVLIFMYSRCHQHSLPDFPEASRKAVLWKQFPFYDNKNKSCFICPALRALAYFVSFFIYKMPDLG